MPRAAVKTERKATRVSARRAFVWAASIALLAGMWIAAAPVNAAGLAATLGAGANAQTQAAAKKKKKKHAAKREPTQKAPSADRVQEIQGALAREGYYKGDPSGKWDADTQDAMRHFQEARGLNGTGKLDAPTLQKLGLGSDIAGVSAPRQGSPADSQQPAKTTGNNSGK